MRTSAKVTLITILFAVITFVLGPVIWPFPEGGFPLTGAQLPLLMAIAALESVAFGLGIAFLLYGWPAIKSLAKPDKTAAVALYVCIAWSLLSWWPHDRMHSSNQPDDMWRLIGIEYGFHLTLIIAAIITAWCFFDIYQKKVKNV